MNFIPDYGMSGAMCIDEWKETIAHLPVASILNELKTALGSNPSAVLVAPPGAGKTTAVPLALVEETWLSGRRILLLAPRRLAARAAARRMAALLDQKVGQTVGYRVRMETRVGLQTRIEVVTEGVLTRMLQSDPSLEGVGLVIFDEFHERSLDADLGLALCKEVQGAFNTRLRLLVMSATLDPTPVADLLGGAPVIGCQGRVYPVETRYVARPAEQPVEQAMARVIRQSIAAGEGNLLAFLPGAAEIRRVCRRLETARLPGGWIVAPLYGTLPRDRQDAAIAPPPSGKHKIVLATAIAETSLTIEQIQVVVDGGLQRAPRFDPGSGMTRLVTLPVSRASADQRRGRAGRLGPGICYRLWAPSTTRGLVPHNRPEILDSDLAALALELAVWGVSDPNVLCWMDPPPGAAYTHARQLLTHLDALDDRGRITGIGRRMAELPVHPRLASMIVAADQKEMGGAACDAAAILSERDPLHFSGGSRDADLRLRLDALWAYRSKQPFQAHECRMDTPAIRRIAKLSADLRRRLGIGRPSDGSSSAGRLLAWAYPDRIGQRRADSNRRFLLANGRGAYFSTPEPLGGSEYLVAAHLDGARQDSRIFMAAAIAKQQLLDQFAHRVRWREEITWDADRQTVSAVRRLVLGALTLSHEAWQDAPTEAIAAAMVAGIRQNGIDRLPWTKALRAWQARVMLLARIEAPGGPWPDIGDDALTQNLEAWLGPAITGMRRFSDLAAGKLSDALHSRLTWRQQRRLDELAPTHITVPSGSRRPIDYSGSVPVLAVRVQEMFGLAVTPTIANGRLPVMLHLLSPAGRPVQITQDLAGFWQNSYRDVKKELKGRYPKHPWPEDPLNAVPTARAKTHNKN